MKMILLAVLLVCAMDLTGATKEVTDARTPLLKVVQLIENLQANCLKEGEEDQREYEDYTEYCEERSGDLDHEMNLGKKNVRDFQATIDEQTAIMGEHTAKVETISAEISAQTSELDKATQNRNKERATFEAEEQELDDTVVMLKRAISALKEGGASMLQTTKVNNVAQALSTMVQASLIGTSDADRLTSLLQASHKDREAADDSDGFGAPAGEVYENKSGGIADLLSDLLDKAEEELSDLRAKETQVASAFKMVKQSLDQAIKYSERDMSLSNKRLSEAKEIESQAEGDLNAAKKKLQDDYTASKHLHHACMTKSERYEENVRERATEMTSLTTAKKAIEDAMAGSSFAQLSFVQVGARLSSREDLANSGVVRLIRDLGHETDSQSLMQLASKMATAISSTSGADPLEKVQQMIVDMIERLEKQESAEAEHAEYCKKQLEETGGKLGDEQDIIKELENKIFRTRNKRVLLGRGIVEVRKELSKLLKSEEQLAHLRKHEHESYTDHKAKVSAELKGTQTAIKVLREAFASKKGSSSSAADSIISILTDIEAQLSDYMSNLISVERAAAGEFDEDQQENALDQASLEQELKFDTKEGKRVKKVWSEYRADEEANEEELRGLIESLRNLKKECMPRAKSYEERQKQRATQLKGLQQALEILEAHSSLIQVSSGRRTLRGPVRAHSQMIAA